MNILVAEDEEDLMDVIEAVLDANGYTVDVAENGAQMLEKASQNEYAAIVSDIMMPVMDGITAVKKLRESGNDTPVLFLTAKTEVDDRINGLDAGADDYLTKPFAVGELLARVRAMTRRSRANTQKVISVYNITLDTEREELTGQNSIRLPAKESHMLGFFMNNPEKDFSTEELIENSTSFEHLEKLEKHLQELSLFHNKYLDPYDFSGKRILVAEGMEINREIAREMLRQTGAVTEFAVDGQDCLEKVMSKPADYYDLILMEFRMRKMDGIETTKRIRALEDEKKAAIPIIAISTKVQEEDRAAAMEAGMNGFTAKPVFVDKLFAMMKQQLQEEEEELQP